MTSLGEREIILQFQKDVLARLRTYEADMRTMVRLNPSIAEDVKRQSEQLGAMVIELCESLKRVYRMAEEGGDTKQDGS